MDCTGTSDYTLSGPADMANNLTLGQKRSEDSGNGWEGPLPVPRPLIGHDNVTATGKGDGPC